MRESGKMLATVLAHLRTVITADMTTQDLADEARRELDKLGGKPAFLGYQGFPDVLCVSVNNEVVHGIPRTTKEINNGDIVSMDFGVLYRGMITDAATSVVVGDAPRRVHDLVATTERSMYAGIDAVRDGVRIGAIGNAIETVLRAGGYGIVRDLVGHGVGHELHEDPNIPNYGKANSGDMLKSGMTIAIEPMATLGTDKVYIAQDDWTILTQDDSFAAHFEHTVLITENGAEILTTL